MAVKFHNRESSYKLLDKRGKAAWLRLVAEREGFGTGDVNYVFTEQNAHREINLRYLGHDYFTDVITFDYSDAEARIVSGDIFIDPHTVADNARQYGVTAANEMLRVMVHGVLHLCGHKDKTPNEQKRMRALEDRYMALYPVSQ